MTEREKYEFKTKIEKTLKKMLEKAEEEDWYEKEIGYPYLCSKKEYKKILDIMDMINKESKYIKICIENTEDITRTVWVYRKS